MHCAASTSTTYEVACGMTHYGAGTVRNSLGFMQCIAHVVGALAQRPTPPGW